MIPPCFPLTCVRSSHANALRKIDATTCRLFGSNRTSHFTDPDQTGQIIAKPPVVGPPEDRGRARAHTSPAPQNWSLKRGGKYRRFGLRRTEDLLLSYTCLVWR